jgi:2-keto-4-pentenoate hydratase/2-oxohepta-3-ene-1,7-dioic acid hydratase in catechol pathway
MKLATYDQGDAPRAGLAVGEFIADLQKASRADGKLKLPAETWELLASGPKARQAAEKLAAKLEKLARRVAAGKERRPKWLIPQEALHLCPPIPNPQKIICIGQNYRDHVLEQAAQLQKSLEPPSEPIFFTKFMTTLNGPYDPVMLPPPSLTQQVDFEVELALVIGSPIKGVDEETALAAIAGYMVMNDITARDCQKSDRQWCRAKSFDGFGPCGPFLVTVPDVAAAGLDPQNLRLWTAVNGTILQDSSTSFMIHSIARLVSHVAQAITLIPGDIISTGTPAGVGAFRETPVFLQRGDVVECGIEGIGTIVNTCE